MDILVNVWALENISQRKLNNVERSWKEFLTEVKVLIMVSDTDLHIRTRGKKDPELFWDFCWGINLRKL